jgi:hypothetical protein
MNLFNVSRRVALAVTALTALGLGLPAFAAHPVPFKGRGDGTITSVVDTPTTRELTASATGLATHLGRFTRTESITIDLFTFDFTGTLTFTAANGDLLKADVAGNLLSAEGTYVFTGGSGRFQNASGSAAFAVAVDGLKFDVTFSGTILY